MYLQLKQLLIGCIEQIFHKVTAVNCTAQFLTYNTDWPVVFQSNTHYKLITVVLCVFQVMRKYCLH